MKNENEGFIDFTKLIDISEGVKNLNGFTNLKEVQVKRFNNTVIKSNIYNCSKCGNKGIIAYMRDGEVHYKGCDCYNIRRQRTKLDKLGLLEIFDGTMRYENIEGDSIQDDWLKKSKSRVKNYINDFKEKDQTISLYVGGKIGCGKTHRCVYALAKLMEYFPNMSIEYFNWDIRYKELVFGKEEDKKELLDMLQNVDLLYLDDFFRLQQNDKLTLFEKETAKSIIDYRYINKRPTIISSQLYLNEIEQRDEAIGSRIREMCRQTKYVINISRDIENRNLRTRKDNNEKLY